jgi:hypothetical protein
VRGYAIAVAWVLVAAALYALQLLSLAGLA